MNTDNLITKGEVVKALIAASLELAGKIPKDYLPLMKKYVEQVNAEIDKVAAARNSGDTVRILNKLVSEGVDHVRAIEGCYEMNEDGIAAALDEAAEYFGVTGYYTKLVNDNEHTYPQLASEE